jgi:outer membrane protein OmpA-like peptidoglycan-associated protein
MTHSYARVSNYTTKVTVDDGRGGVCSATAPITVIQKFVLADKGRKVLFDFNKAVLKPEARAQLAGVLQALKEQPSLQVQIVGHTDGVGSDAYNMKLSQRRAESVADYLIKNGSRKEYLQVDWKGKRDYSLECDRIGSGSKPSCGNHVVSRALVSTLKIPR